MYDDRQAIGNNLFEHIFRSMEGLLCVSSFALHKDHVDCFFFRSNIGCKDCTDLDMPVRSKKVAKMAYLFHVHHILSFHIRKLETFIVS